LVYTVAIGAGCCTDLLNNVNADIIITGEFLHHEILHEVSRGVSVIATDHSNTERGYIEFFKTKFSQMMLNKDVEILISETDRDPLEYL
jgi:putative NIF3 family GTP cyclohydrolase 1 type 2